MQEVLSRTKDCENLSPETEFYELRLSDSELRSSDSEFVANPAFCVKQARARWVDAEQGIVWDVPDIWVFNTIQEAEAQYESKRRSLGEKGFIYSDMD